MHMRVALWCSTFRKWAKKQASRRGGRAGLCAGAHSRHSRDMLARHRLRMPPAAAVMQACQQHMATHHRPL